MSFATFTEDPQPDPPPEGVTEDITIDQLWWPAISLQQARKVVRVHGTVSDDRLLDALTAAAMSVNRDLGAWRDSVLPGQPDGLTQDQAFLYLRAVHFHAKAELLERYRDFDSSGDYDRRAEAATDNAEDARRIERWSVSELTGRPRLTVELM